MKQRAIKVLVVLMLVISLFGCKSTPTATPTDVETATEVSSAPSVPEIKYEVNPLTGELNILPENVGKRPVAVMINNFKDGRNNAQGVQASLADADIIFESLAEGGITRLMAVFYDVSKVGQIGTVRSARYTYA